MCNELCMFWHDPPGWLLEAYDLEFQNKVIRGGYILISVHGDDLKYNKSIWWMPWRIEAMKDVLRCDKRRLAAKKLWSDDFRMGKPGYFIVIFIWIHRVKKRTQGTETSKYLKERTSTETPLVVASERGPGQWLVNKN